MMDATTPIYNATMFHNETIDKYKFICPFNWNQITAPSVLIWIFFFLGIFTNSVTIAVIASSKKLRSPFMLVLMSLCFTDLLSAVISPLSWYRKTYGFEFWALSTPLCKIFWALDTLATFSTGINVLYYVIMRYVHVTIRKGYKINPRKTKIALLVIWFVVIVVSCPLLLFAEINSRQHLSGHVLAKYPSCSAAIKWAAELINYFRITGIVFIVLPAILSILISTMIAIQIRGHILRSSKKLKDMKKAKRRMRERYAFIQLVLIVTSYLFSYMPFFIYNMWASSGPSSTHNAVAISYWLGMVQYIVMRFAECINPILYNIGSPKLRRYTGEYINLHANFLSCEIKRKSVATVSSNTQSTITPDIDNK